VAKTYAENGEQRHGKKRDAAKEAGASVSFHGPSLILTGAVVRHYQITISPGGHTAT
jgi:hypothetical protein